jgi:hypothetical protein
MRSIRYVPLAFLAGIHGFALFAPYMAFFLTANLLFKRRRVEGAIPLPVPAPAQAGSLLQPVNY